MVDTSTVSTYSIINMAISAALAILVPIGVIIYMAVKKKLNWKATLFGVLLFVGFALVLEQIMHLLVLGMDPSKSPIYKNILLYMLYGGFAAGIFEETARFLGFKFMLKVKENEPIETGISYGLGHGGIEAVLVGGLAAVSNLILSVMLNSGALGHVTGSLQSSQLNSFNQQIHSLVSTPSYVFIMPGFERISALILQIGLSLFVFKAVREKKWQYFCLAILLHAGIDMFAVLFQRGVIKNISILEIVVFIASLIVTGIALKINKKLPAAQETESATLE